jgi:hypothetical protein
VNLSCIWPDFDCQAGLAMILERRLSGGPNGGR